MKAIYKEREKELNNGKKYSDYFLFFLFCVYISLMSLTLINGEDDLFWHMSTGRYIAENGIIPQTDVFGWFTEGWKWIPFEWLWDLTAFIIFTNTSYIGLYVLTILLAISTFFVLYKFIVGSGVSPVIAVIILVIASLGVKYRIGLKPQMFSYFFLAITVYLTAAFKYLKINPKFLFFIPLVFLLWGNIHMGVIAGLGYLLIFYIFEISSFLKNKVKEENKENRKIFFVITLVLISSFIAVLLNPHGIQTYIYAISHTNMKMLDEVYEWYSPFSENYLGKVFIYVYILFLAGIYPVTRYSLRKKDYFPLIVVSLFAVHSLRAVRFTTDYILLSIPFIIIAFINHGLLSEKIKKIFTENRMNIIYITGLLLVILILLIPGNSLFRFIGFNSAFGIGIYEPAFPVKMFDYIKEKKIAELGEKPFQTFEYGGFFLWNFPGRKNFIDSRNLDDSVYFTFKKIFNKNPGFEKLINDFGIDYFIIHQPLLTANPNLMKNTVIAYLENNKNWKLAYWDDASMLYLKSEGNFRMQDLDYYEYITPYSILYDNRRLQDGKLNNNDKYIKELNRKKSQEPSGIFINHLSKVIK